MIKGTQWNRLPSVHFSDYIFLLIATVFIRLLVSIYKIQIILAVNVN